MRAKLSDKLNILFGSRNYKIKNHSINFSKLDYVKLKKAVDEKCFVFDEKSIVNKEILNFCEMYPFIQVNGCIYLQERKVPIVLLNGIYVEKNKIENKLSFLEDMIVKLANANEFEAYGSFYSCYFEE